MVVGISALIAPILIDRQEIRVDTLVMIGATIAMAAAVWVGILARWAGICMVVAIGIYVAYQYRASKVEEYEEEERDSSANPYLMVFFGIGILILGSEILVQGAVAGGYSLGVPEAVIGITVIAFGTSLPELTACVAAARKNQSDMIVGGIIGSNIFNILSVLAVSAVVRPLVIDERFVAFDLPAVLIVTAVFSMFLLFVGRIGRVVGLVMLISYFLFTFAQYGGITAALVPTR